MAWARLSLLMTAVLCAAACESCTEPAEESPASDEDVVAEVDDPNDEDASQAPSFAVDDELAAALGELGYVDTAPTDNPEARGVTDQEAAAWDGINLYSSRHRARAILTDVGGEELHRWQVIERGRSWMHIEPLPNGEILAITRDTDITKHDWDSNVIWRREIRAHHDLAVHSDGRIFALVRNRRSHTVGNAEVPVLTDGIAILGPDGEVQRTVQLLPLLVEHVRPRRFQRILEGRSSGMGHELFRPGGRADLFHTNSIEILTQAIEGVAPVGSVLLSVRELDRILILSSELDEVLWIWGAGELQGQHDATLLDNGHILVFDNGSRRRRSRVLEVDPRREEIVWSYEGEDLYTQLRGGAQKLPNGNVLITESDSGHALEVTREGEAVWEFWNPDIRETTPPQRAVMYRLNRYPAGLFAAHLSPEAP